MNPDFRARLDETLSDYRAWLVGRTLTSCRLVQYCGPDFGGAITVPLGDVPAQIEGLLGEAYRVDWAEHRSRLYLRVYEPDGPEPDWPKVFAEESLYDTDAVLRREGIDTGDDA